MIRGEAQSGAETNEGRRARPMVGMVRTGATALELRYWVRIRVRRYLPVSAE